jgi:hypothetical protein
MLRAHAVIWFHTPCAANVQLHMSAHMCGLAMQSTVNEHAPAPVPCRGVAGVSICRHDLSGTGDNGTC